MSQYYARMATADLQDELDRLEAQLDEAEDDDLYERAGIRNRIFYICDILCRREYAAWTERRRPMSQLEKEAYELYRTIWSRKLLKEDPASLPPKPDSSRRRTKNPNLRQLLSCRKAGWTVMNIIDEAKSASPRIRNNQDLLTVQKEMLETMLQHHAISEAEYRRSLTVLLRTSK